MVRRLKKNFLTITILKMITKMIMSIAVVNATKATPSRLPLLTICDLTIFRFLASIRTVVKSLILNLHLKGMSGFILKSSLLNVNTISVRKSSTK